MASPLATRIWISHTESGRPFPVFSQDDVLDYMVMEAVTLKALTQRREAQEKQEKHQERDSWKNKTDELRKRIEG